MRSLRTIHKSPILSILLISTVILTAIQFTTLERIKRVLLNAPGATGKVPALIAALTPVDFFIFAVLGLIVLLAIVLEFRGKHISSDLSRLLSTESGALTILAIVAVASARFYLAPGEIILCDSPCHISRVYAVIESFSSRSWPSWSFYNYGGYPLLRFYAPGFFVITGALSLLTDSPSWTVKILLFLLHAGSAFPVYFWAKTIGASRASALLSGSVITLSFLHTHTVIWTGALPVSAVFILYPLIFLAIEKLLHGGDGRWVVILSGAVFLIVLSHHGYAAYGLQLAMIYLLFRWYLSGDKRPRPRSLLQVFLAIATGLSLCAFFLFPVLAEGRWVFLPGGECRLHPAIPGLAFFKSLLVWRNGWSGYTLAYIGLSVFAFFIAGSWRVIRNHSGNSSAFAARTVAITALLALSCAAGRGRVINLALPFIAVMAGFAANSRPGEKSVRRVLLLLVILLIDLGPATIQSPYRTGREFIREGLQRAGATISPERTITGYHNGSRWAYPQWAYSEGTGIIQPNGFFPQGAPRMINTVTAVIDNLNASHDSLDTSLPDELYLLNVSGLVMRTRDGFIRPEPKGSEGPLTEPPVAWILPSSPLIYSDIVVISPPDSLTRIQESGLLMNLPENDAARTAYARMVSSRTMEMGIDRENASAERFFLWPGETAGLSATRSMDRYTGVSIDQYETSIDRVIIRFKTDKAGWIRAAFSWYPSLHAAVDGERVHVYRSILGACIMQVPAGEHTLELKPESSDPIPGIAGLVIGMIILFVTIRFFRN